MSVDKGKRVPKLHAAYLQTWWPLAEANPNGRNGRDILGTPGVWFEDKTPQAFRPAAFIAQAAKGAATADEVPVVTYWPKGVWADIDKTIAMMPTPWLMRLLQEAKYTP